MGKATQREFTLKMLDDALAEGHESDKIGSISLPQKPIPIAKNEQIYQRNNIPFQKHKA